MQNYFSVGAAGMVWKALSESEQVNAYAETDPDITVLAAGWPAVPTSLSLDGS